MGVVLGTFPEKEVVYSMGGGFFKFWLTLDSIPSLIPMKAVV